MTSAISTITLPQILVLIAALMAGAYGVIWLPRAESLLRAIAKTAPMIVLILATLVGGLPLLILAALAACTAGDWFLAFEDERSFHLGLGSFLTGHLLFIVYFVTTASFELVINQDFWLLVVVLTGLVAMVLLRLWPYLDTMRVPVALYSIVIATMALTARLANPGTIVLAGIALFMTSDILLANDKFTPLTNSPLRRAIPWLVWIFYFGGQALIVSGLLITK